mgnify:CR=1 FL=1
MNRTSQRYVLVKFLPSQSLSAEAIERSVYQSIKQMLGEFGSAEMSARMIGFDDSSNKAVFRCNAPSVEKLRAVLALMTQMEGNPVAAMVLRSSGTIKALRARIPRRGR